MNFKKVKNFFSRVFLKDISKFFEMSVSSDAVWIVRDVLEEILGMVFFRDVQEKFEAEMITEKSDRIEVNEKCDWVSLINAEKKWIDGTATATVIVVARRLARR